MPESTITIKGQTTLPKDVRHALNLTAGDKVRYIILDGGEVRLVRSQPIAKLSGLLKSHVKVPISLETMNEVIAKAAAGL